MPVKITVAEELVSKQSLWVWRRALVGMCQQERQIQDAKSRRQCAIDYPEIIMKDSKLNAKIILYLYALHCLQDTSKCIHSNDLYKNPARQLLILLYSWLNGSLKVTYKQKSDNQELMLILLFPKPIHTSHRRKWVLSKPGGGRPSLKPKGLQ